MGKQLILFRHGKSDWEGDFGNDHERPVAKRGIKAAKVMGRLLTKAAQQPDAIITSSAARARTTIEIAAQTGHWSAPIRITDSLYEASPAQVLEVIHQEPDTTERLMLVGHEPTWSELTSHLIGGGRIGVPTAALVGIEFELDAWSKVEYGLGLLFWLMPPRFFTDGDFEFA